MTVAHRGPRRFRAARPFFVPAASSTTIALAFASRAAYGAALRGGYAALLPHQFGQPTIHQRQPARFHLVQHRSGIGHRIATVLRDRIRLRIVADRDGNARRATVTTPMVTMPMVTTPVVTMLPMMVQQLDRRCVFTTMDLGDPLRGRAIRCNRRCASISASIPVAPVSFAHSALRLASRRQRRAGVLGAVPGITVCSSRPRFARRSPRRVPHPRRRCELRSSPARAPCDALVPPLVRALLRSAPALRSALRRAVASDEVRWPLSAPPAPCRARPPAVVSAPPVTQSPWRLQSAGFAGIDSPFALAASRCFRGRRRRLVLTPHAARCRVCHGHPWRALSETFGAFRCLVGVGPSRCSGEPRTSDWIRLYFSGAVLQRTADFRLRFSREPCDSSDRRWISRHSVARACPARRVNPRSPASRYRPETHRIPTRNRPPVDIPATSGRPHAAVRNRP